MIADYTDAHNPRSESCPHNNSPENPCTCKRTKNRKPFRTVKVNDPHVARGIRPSIVAELHPDGRLVLRESGRRLRVETHLGAIYADCLMRQARQEILAKRAARKERKLARRR